ncbi:MAG: hypothetical protein E7234_02080 [Lachnospiraceae bacterium]|nr:hypothetical protein [Lachnospiraceae bacterium]
MNNLVFIKNNDVFTDSLVIAKETGNEHRAVRQLIRTYEKQFQEFGTLNISNVKSTGGRPEQFYELNEPQATFLITLFKNNAKVVNFKLALVKEFYAMRLALMERQSTEWLITRKQGKLIRRNTTDTIQDLILYAEKQGSSNMRKAAYLTYTKLVNTLVGIKSGQRDIVPFKTLSVISFLEDMIIHTIQEEMESGTYYKEIYKKCKINGMQIMRFAYLDRLTA